MSDKLVLLKRTEMQGEAAIIKSYLESHGIPVYVMDNTDVLNYIGFSGTRLMVAEHDIETARQLIESKNINE